MAYTILWCDGFDEIEQIPQKYAATTEQNSAMNADAPPAYNYGRAVRVQNGWFGKLLAGAPFTVLFASFDLMIRNNFDVTDQFYLEFWDLAASQIQVSIRSRVNRVSGIYDLVLRRGAADLHTWPGVLTPSQYSHISIKCIIDPASGSVELGRNGISLGSFTGNTRNTANTRVDQFRASHVNTDRIALDNLVVATGLASDPPLPVSRVYGANVPNANVSVAWTPSSGSNWQTVDEIPPSDTDYNSATASGAVDVFSHAAIASVGSQVLGVKVNARSWSDTSDQMNAVVRVGSTDYFGPNRSLNTNYISNWGFWQQNPATGLDWTPADAIAAGFGYRRV